MQNVAYVDLLNNWADVVGIEADDLQTLDKARFNRAFNRLIRRAWEWNRWPQLHSLEERYYRPIWSAQVYAIDVEVYHEGTAGYYRAADDTTAADEPGSSARWTQLEPSEVDAYIAYEQDGEEGFNFVTDVWSANPRLSTTARRLRWTFDERGVFLAETSVPATVWINLYKRCPRWVGDDWTAADTYTAGRCLYFSTTTQDFTGDFWLVLDTTTPGQSPITAAAKFARILIPDFMGEFIIAGARIAFLKGEGQLEKALAEDGNPLWDLLADERNKLFSGGAAPRRARVANL
jgi:hypothetical protein